MKAMSTAALDQKLKGCAALDVLHAAFDDAAPDSPDRREVTSCFTERWSEAIFAMAAAQASRERWEVMAETYDLKALRAAADDLTNKAYNVEWTSACINWGDFCCVRAEHYVTEEGAEGYRVYFEEAAPENSEFCAWVTRELEAAGFMDVEAVCEW